MDLVSRIVVTLEIEGEPADAIRAVRKALDDGVLQEAIEEYADVTVTESHATVTRSWCAA